jgi:hypothetical protein
VPPRRMTSNGSAARAGDQDGRNGERATTAREKGWNAWLRPLRYGRSRRETWYTAQAQPAPADAWHPHSFHSSEEMTRRELLERWPPDVPVPGERRDSEAFAHRRTTRRLAIRCPRTDPIHLERAKDADEPGIDFVLAAWRQQRVKSTRGGQAAVKGFRNHVCVARSLTTAWRDARPHRGLDSRRGRIHRTYPATLDQSPDEGKSTATSIADLSVFVQIEDADVGQFRCLSRSYRLPATTSSQAGVVGSRRSGGVQIDADKAARR